MQPIKIAPKVVGVFAILVFMAVGASGCGSTTIIRQTVVVGTTVLPSVPPATATPTVVPKPPPGIWCLVKQGRMPLVSACEIYPSEPRLHTPTQGEPVLAGTFVGPEIGKGEPYSVTEHMNSPWAADVDCATNLDSNIGKVRIFMVAHTSSGDFYSWGDQSCGEPAAPSYGKEYFRKATVTLTLSIYPLTSNLVYWGAQFIQL